LAEAWKQWDWRQAEKELNKVPQFHTGVEIAGFGTLDIHFVYQKSNVEGAIPLLFIHGWPGSFVEVLKILPLLAQQDENSPAFTVVAPSLPNYGFSEGVKKRGFAMAQYAETCHKLMLKLGYREYVTQGGDWGSHISRAIGKLYPESCKASHINMMMAFAPTYAKHPLLALQHTVQSYSEKDKRGLERSRWFGQEGTGYNHEQATKPQTLAYALTDSPVGLLAWIYEKLHDWTDSYPWTDDEILRWVSVYQFSRAGPGAAHRIYYENKHASKSKEGVSGRVVTRDEMVGYIGGVPLGLTYNPMELSVVPKTWARTLGDVVFEAENDHGGHFYASEHPELLVRDLRAMFGKGGACYGVVKGKDGYGDGVRARL